jgi:3-oxoacyl-(acyl-carrier-protein) synthase
VRPLEAATPVVCGSGLVTALGPDLASTAAALAAGRSAVRRIEGEPDASPLAYAALVAPPWLRAAVPASVESQRRLLNGAGELAAEAAAGAWAAARASERPVPGDAQGLWLCQTDTWDWGLIDLRPAFVEASAGFTGPYADADLNRAAPGRVRPFFLLESLKNNAFSFLAGWHDLRGGNTSTSGYGGALLLLDLAARAVERGEQDRALVVAAARVASGVARADLALHGLRERGDDRPYRPLDAGGRGVVPGEGAAALVVERAGEALPGCAVALLGFGAATGDPLPDLPAPTATTVRAAVGIALAEARAAPGDLLGAVVPSLARPASDLALLAGLDHPVLQGVPVVSWRGATGHLASAGDLVDVVIAAEALASRALPGTAGLASPLAPPVSREAVRGDASGVLVVGAGLEGQAFAAVLARSSRDELHEP